MCGAAPVNRRCAGWSGHHAGFSCAAEARNQVAFASMVAEQQSNLTCFKQLQRGRQRINASNARRGDTSQH